MRKAIYILFLLVSAGVNAQDAFVEILEKANRATTHEAIYILSEYQQVMPSHAATYYHLGVRYYELIGTENPIRDHNEFQQILYHTKLCFNNCLQYAQDQNLKPQHYVGLPIAGKKLEYSDVERFIRAKLDTVETVSSRSEAVYHNCFRLVNRYALCRNMFTDFCERYTSEKMAHLLLTDADREQLGMLQVQADSLQEDIRLLQEALAAYPVAEYQPDFEWVEIDLYRLDGLSNTDFLQNKVVLWNYANWVRKFLDTQENVYTVCYDEIDIEYQLMLRAMTDLQNGKKRKMDYNTTLLNRIDRIDYQSFMKEFIESAQRCVAVMCVELPDMGDEYVEQALTVLLRQNENINLLKELEKLLDEKLQRQPAALAHYSALLSKWNCSTPDSVMLQERHFVKMAEEAFTASATAFATTIEPTIAPFEHYLNELTGDKFGVKNLQFEPTDSIKAIIPVENKYMVVQKNGTCHIVAADGTLVSTQTHDLPDVMTAYKRGSNTIALIAPNRVLFVNKDGK